MAITSPHLDSHLQRSNNSGLRNYSVSGSTVSVSTPTLSAQELRELVRVAEQAKHEVSLSSGTLQIKPA